LCRPQSSRPSNVTPNVRIPKIPKSLVSLPSHPRQWTPSTAHAKPSPLQPGSRPPKQQPRKRLRPRCRHMTTPPRLRHQPALSQAQALLLFTTLAAAVLRLVNQCAQAALPCPTWKNSPCKARPSSSRRRSGNSRVRDAWNRCVYARLILSKKEQEKHRSRSGVMAQKRQQFLKLKT